MGKMIRALVWLLAGLFLAYDLYLWGGLAVTPIIGSKLREQASVQSPIAASYLFLGRHAVDAAGRARPAMEFAAKRFPEQVADTEVSREIILSHFLSAQRAISRLAYYGAPLLLVLSLVLHVRRPRQIRSLGVKG